jgi:hypothetical protein
MFNFSVKVSGLQAGLIRLNLYFNFRTSPQSEIEI